MSNMEDVNAVFENGQFVDRVFPDEDTIMMRTWYDTPRWKFFYKGLMFNLKRNFTGRFGFLTNFSWMWRTYRKVEWDPGDPDQFVYPSPSSLDMENYGRRWSFHFSAFYRLPFDITIATYINGNDGSFIADETGDYEWDASSARIYLRSNNRRVTDIIWSAYNEYYVGKQWGSSGRRTDPLWSINFRLAKSVNIDRFRVEAAIDFFNVFNWCAYSSFSSNDIRRDIVDEDNPVNIYQRQTSPQPPRSAQLSLKFRF